MSIIQTTQRVTFTSIATILIPIGIGLLNTELIAGLVIILTGIGSLVAREYFKVIE